MISNQFSNESLKEATEFSLRVKINKNLLFLLMFYVLCFSQYFLYKYFPFQKNNRKQMPKISFFEVFRSLMFPNSLSFFLVFRLKYISSLQPLTIFCTANHLPLCVQDYRTFRSQCLWWWVGFDLSVFLESILPPATPERNMWEKPP